MGSEVFERLDDTLLRLMESLKELSSLRNRYRTVVKEVSIIWSCSHWLRKSLFCRATSQCLSPGMLWVVLTMSPDCSMTPQ